RQPLAIAERGEERALLADDALARFIGDEPAEHALVRPAGQGVDDPEDLARILLVGDKRANGPDRLQRLDTLARRPRTALSGNVGDRRHRLASPDRIPKAEF